MLLLYMSPAKVLEGFADCRRQSKPAKLQRKMEKFALYLYRHKLCNFADNKVMKVIKEWFGEKIFQEMFILTLILTFNFMASNHIANITIENMENRVKI